MDSWKRLLLHLPAAQRIAANDKAASATAEGSGTTTMLALTVSMLVAAALDRSCWSAMEIVNVPLYGPDVVRPVVRWRDETGNWVAPTGVGV